MKTSKKLLLSAGSVTAAYLVLSAGSCSKQQVDVPATRPSSNQAVGLMHVDTESEADKVDLFDESLDIKSISHNSTKVYKSLQERAAEIDMEIKKTLALLEKEREDRKTGKKDFDESFQTVFFQKESALLPGEQAEVMAENIKIAKKAADAGKIVVIRGHSDFAENHNDEIANIALSDSRAQEIKKSLLAAGVPEDRIEVAALGSADPLIWGGPQDMYAEKNLYNQRVDIITL